MRVLNRSITFGILAISVCPAWGAKRSLDSARVRVEVYENVPAGKELSLDPALRTESYQEHAFGFVRIPTKYSGHALPLDRSTPFILCASMNRAFPPGEYDFRLRARNAAWLLIDGRVVASTQPQR